MEIRSLFKQLVYSRTLLNKLCKEIQIKATTITTLKKQANEFRILNDIHERYSELKRKLRKLIRCTIEISLLVKTQSLYDIQTCSLRLFCRKWQQQFRIGPGSVK